MRETWKRPDAVVVTDSGAVLNLQGPPVNATSTAEAAAMAINNGTDMNDGHGFQALATAVAQGLTTEEKVDTALKRALRQLFSVGLFDQPSATDWTQTIKKDVINISSTKRPEMTQHCNRSCCCKTIRFTQPSMGPAPGQQEKRRCCRSHLARRLQSWDRRQKHVRGCSATTQ